MDLKTIISGKYKNIIICSGAGVSTSSGIPDYRSSAGIFNQLSQKYKINGMLIFTRSYINSNPHIKQDPIYVEFKQTMVDALPTPAHYLAKQLNDLGFLRRVYTQNVDGLYQKTGLPEDKIVEFHGNFIKDTTVLYGDPIPPSVITSLNNDMNDKEVDLIIVMGTTLKVAPFCNIPKMVSNECQRVLVDLYPNEVEWSYMKNDQIFTMSCDNFANEILQ